MTSGWVQVGVPKAGFRCVNLPVAKARQPYKHSHNLSASFLLPYTIERIRYAYACHYYYGARTAHGACIYSTFEKKCVTF